MIRLFGLFSLFILLLTGCSVKYDDVLLNHHNQCFISKTNTKTTNRINKLSQQIQSLSKEISPKESNKFAYTTTYYAMHLANNYQLVSPALYHNFLINQKQKKRGLCYHWVTDILKYLENSNFKTLGIYKVVANKGLHNEHNAISITAPNHPFDEGILIDAWRGSGKLFFIPIKEDRYYNWKLRRKIQ